MRSTDTTNEKRIRRTEGCTRRIKQTDSKSCSERQSETVARVKGKTSSELVYFETTQPVITCSKVTIKTLEQGVKYVQS